MTALGSRMQRLRKCSELPLSALIELNGLSHKGHLLYSDNQGEILMERQREVAESLLMSEDIKKAERNLT